MNMVSWVKKAVAHVCFALSVLALPTIAYAQNAEKEIDKKIKVETSRDASLKVMPFFNYNRNLKFMFGAIPMYMFQTSKEDTISPKSISGLAAVYTTNSSWFVSVFNQIFFNEDRWRVRLYAVTGNMDSQFFVGDIEGEGFFDYSTESTVISAGVQRKVVDHVYLGVNYTYSDYYTTYQDGILDPEKTLSNGLEFTSQFDTRDQIYYPRKGIQAKLNWLAMPEWFANDEAANKIQARYNQYFGMQANRDVLAVRFSGVFGLGDIAFQQQVKIGGKDIRGYSKGQFRGDGIIAIQGEYRYNFHRKMGLVGFAGLTTLYGSDTPSFDWEPYPGAGVGFRYKAFDDVHFNIGLDAAVGKDDWGLYFRIGEAF